MTHVPMNIETPFAPLLDLLVKSAALILIGTALLAVLRKASAANRHAVSAAIFVALLLLPFTKLMPARWSFSLEKPAPPAVNVRLPLIAAGQGSGGHTSAQPVANAAQPAQPAPRAPLVIPWKKLAVIVWLAGAAFLLARRALIALRLRAIVRGSFPIEDARLAAKVRALVESGGVRAEVRESDRCPVPMASGFARPVVLLPVEAADWSDAFISSALRHELGHIHRRDCTTRLLADVLCALYWVNPLVWFAARRMRLAQEQACDDLVLNAGAPADEYAGQLVEVVRSLQGDRFTARHALAMAQPSTLETRVLAIVDDTRDRSARSLRGAFAGIAFAAAALALCTAAQLRGADEKKAAADANAPQILIEAKFIEITGEPEGLPDFLKPSAVMKKRNDGDFLIPSDNLGSGLPVGFPDSATATEALGRLKEMKGVELLSAPRVTTCSDQRALIEIVREVRYATEWKKDAQSGAQVPSAFETKNVGLSFEVTPVVLPDGYSLDLDMKPQIVEFEGFTDLDAPEKMAVGKPDASKPFGERLAVPQDGIKIPEGHRAQAVFHTRKLHAAVTVHPGATVVLGGLDGKDAGGSAKDGAGNPQKRLVVLVTARLANADAAVPVKAAMAKPDTRWIFPKIDFRDATVREIVDFLVEKSKRLDEKGKGANIVLRNADEIGDVRITLTLNNVPLAALLRYVTEVAGCELVREEFAFVIGPKQAPNADRQKAVPNAPAVPLKPAGAALKKAGAIIFPKIDFRDATLSESVEYLRLKSKDLDPDKKGVNLIVKAAAAGEEARITLTLANVPLSEALRYVAALAGYEIVADENAIALRPAAK